MYSAQVCSRYFESGFDWGSQGMETSCRGVVVVKLSSFSHYSIEEKKVKQKAR